MSDSQHSLTDSSDDNSPRRTGARRWLGLAVGLIVVAAAVSIGISIRSRPALPPSVSQEEYDQAEAQFRRMFSGSPSHSDILVLLAESAVQDERNQIAVDCFSLIPTDDARYGTSARFQEAQVLLRMNRADGAEQSFREFLAVAEERQAPQDHTRLAREFLAFILSVELRLEDRREILRDMERDGQLDIYTAKQLYFPTLLIWRSSLGSTRLRQFLDQDPDSLNLQIAHARYLVSEGRLSDARQALEELHNRFPHQPDVVAALLECCYELDDWKKISNVLSKTGEPDSEELWVTTQVRGAAALREHRWSDAETYFRNVIAQDAANSTCHIGLAEALQGQGKSSERTAVQQRSVILAKIRVKLAAANRTSPDAARELAEFARELEMTDAARTFDQLASQMEANQG